MLESIEKIIFYEIYDTRVYFQYKDDEFPDYVFSDSNIMEERLTLTRNEIKTLFLVSEGTISFKLRKIYTILVRGIYKTGENITNLLVSENSEVMIKFDCTGERYV